MSLRPTAGRSPTILVFPNYCLPGPYRSTLASLLLGAANDTTYTSLLAIFSTVYTSFCRLLLLAACPVATGSKLLDVHSSSVKTFLSRQT